MPTVPVKNRVYLAKHDYYTFVEGYADKDLITDVRGAESAAIRFAHMYDVDDVKMDCLEIVVEHCQSKQRQTFVVSLLTYEVVSR